MNSKNKTGDTLRILVVDDDFVSRQILYEILNPYGKADKANDGKEALEAFNKAMAEDDPYDLIMLDIMMPKMDGRQVLEKIRQIEDEKEIEKPNRVKIIMVTGLADTRNILQSFERGCEGYLTKPLDKAKLLNLLRTLDFGDIEIDF